MVRPLVVTEGPDDGYDELVYDPKIKGHGVHVKRPTTASR